jgi:hypothetical protein
MNFKLIFKNKTNTIDLNYQLCDTDIANRWFKKLKLIHVVPISVTESTTTKPVYTLDHCYKVFCDRTNTKYEILDYDNQENLNYLHKLYEKAHDYYSTVKDSDFLYSFHGSIHKKESGSGNPSSYNVGWGVKDGLSTELHPCNQYYSKNLKQNNIYLRWAELGKKPLSYFNNKEPDNLARILELVKPHMTFRSAFFIPFRDRIPNKLPVEFINWFDNYKDPWFDKHNLNKWDEFDEKCSVPLAECVTKFSDDLTQFDLKKIEINI